MRLLALVLGARATPYPTLIRAIRRTWASVPVSDVETLFYYGGPELRRDGDEIVLPVPDDLRYVGHKTLACFEYLLEHDDFDLVFRANASSYVDLANLRAFASGLTAPRRFYGGVLGMRGQLPFASGSGYFLGRELAEAVLERRGEWEHKLPDDAALATVLAELGVAPEATRRQDFGSLLEVRRVDTTQFHIRCRTGSYRPPQSFP